MSNDETSRFLQETLLAVIKDKFEIAESAEEANAILKKIEKGDLTDLFTESYSKMADNTLNYMKETMYE